MEIRFDGKTVLVTGAGAGIGAGVAKAFAANGAYVVICDNREDKIKAVAEEINAAGGKARWMTCDITDVEQVEAFMNCEERVDIVVQVAGIYLAKTLLGADQERIQRMVDVNVMGTSNVIRAALNKMKDNGEGKIVVYASQAARNPGDFTAHYRMTKAATASITMSAAEAAAPYNINVNGIAPGFVETDMFHTQMVSEVYGLEPYSKEASAKYAERFAPLVRLKRLQTVEDMANATMFLCSDLAKNITGQLLNVDGGCTLQI